MICEVLTNRFAVYRIHYKTTISYIYLSFLLF